MFDVRKMYFYFVTIFKNALFTFYYSLSSINILFFAIVMLWFFTKYDNLNDFLTKNKQIKKNYFCLCGKQVNR